VRRGLPSLPLVLSVLLSVLAVALSTVSFGLGGHDSDPLLAAASATESHLLRQAASVDGGDPANLDRFASLGRPFDLALADGLARTPAGSPERSLLLAQGDLAAEWRSATVRALAAGEAGQRAGAANRAAMLDRFARRSAELRSRIVRANAASARHSWRVQLALVLGLATLALAGAAVAAVRGLRRHAARATARRLLRIDDERYRAHEEEFARALQGARSDREAQRMLKRQLERTLAGSSATVLNRNNSDNRLEAVTSLPADSALAATVPDAEPGDCLAVRFGQPHHRAAGSAPLLGCELCGAVAGSVTCVPSLVGGEVIGSVLVETPDPLDDGGQRRVTDAVAHAAPVLSSMRNLRLAETRASTDALTGLPNRRSAEESLKRMLAQAGRTVTPCAVALFDLDHFKNVNDVYGHDKGDALLAAIGDIAGSKVRASDFVARFGGEEFLLVLPDTDLDGALVACEQLRGAIADVRIAGLGQRPSASFGVAVFPQDGSEPEGLLRGADRALYAAKSSGRNCVRALRSIDQDAEPADGLADAADAAPAGAG
jgi:diguanylate cyclase (GGDEF)-like protein